jgi:hypothetical protein
VLAARELGIFKFVPGPTALWRSNGAIYELVGEPMRRLQAALGVRERFDKRVTGTGASPGVASAPDPVPAQAPALASPK